MSGYLEDIPCQGRSYYYKPAWTKTGLMEIAKKLKVEGRSRMTKAQLCRALKKGRSGSRGREAIKKALAMKEKYGKRAMKERFCSRHSSRSKCKEYGNICTSKRVPGKRKGTTRHACVHKSRKSKRSDSRASEYFEKLREAEINRKLKKRGRSRARSFSSGRSRSRSQSSKRRTTRKQSKLGGSRGEAGADALLAFLKEKKASRDKRESSRKKNAAVEDEIAKLLAMVRG